MGTSHRRRWSGIALAALTVATGSLAITANAQSEEPAMQRPTIVLVHGAWADGSSWGRIIPPLLDAGYDVTAVQLPLTSEAADVATLRSVMESQPGPTLVVAHSYGGWVTTALGPDAPNLAGIVYVAAFAPDEGESPSSFAKLEPQPAGLAALRPDAAGNLWLDREGFLTGFADGVETDEARLLAAVQKPVAAATLLSETPAGPPAWAAVPTWYLIAEKDQIIPPQAQELFAARMGATTSTVDTGHLPMFVKPTVVTDLVLSAASSLAEAS